MMTTEKEQTRKWKISDIGKFLLTCLGAIVKGQFILRLKLDKFFPQIAWTFFLFMMAILYSLGVDMTLGKVEDGKKKLSELEVLYTQKSYELISLNRRSTVSNMLEKAGSKVKEPEKPAILVK